jgi:hypothetical protein
MNIKHLFFYMLLIAFSSCSKPGYEKAIAEWVQTDFHGTWTDLKFELLEVLEIEDVTVSDSLRHLNNTMRMTRSLGCSGWKCICMEPLRF